jgi:hypothetical protein
MGLTIESFIEWISFAPNIATIFIIGTICEVLKKLILGKKSQQKSFTGWKNFYFVTYKAQAIVLGVLIGLIPYIPTPEAFQSDGIAGTVLNYAGCGAAAMVVYAVIVGNAKNFLKNIRKLDD